MCVKYILLVLLSRELLFEGTYPVAGGLSGNCAKNSPRATLKGFSSVMLFRLRQGIPNLSRSDTERVIKGGREEPLGLVAELLKRCTNTKPG